MRFTDSHDGHGITHYVEDLDFIPGFLIKAAGVVLHDRGDITTTQTFRRDVLRQNDVTEERIFHERSGGVSSPADAGDLLQ